MYSNSQRIARKGGKNDKMAKVTDKKKIAGWGLLAVKYLFSLAVTVLAYTTIHRRVLLATGCAELVMIFSFCSLFLCIVPVLGHTLHFVFTLIYDAQMLVIYFGSSAVTRLMLSNLVFLEDLSGHFGQYLLMIVPLVLILLIPLRTEKRLWKALFALLVLSATGWVFLLGRGGTDVSPLYNTGVLIGEEIRFEKMKRASVGEENGQYFYREGITDAVSRPQSLPETPNVVLIFCEGISQQIVDDPRDIMPHLKALESESVFFTRYYDHTFATLRGLSGQLYSGYQLEDYDANALVSMQSMLSERGYATTFFNTEPLNDRFTEYLRNLRFDLLISEADMADPSLGYVTDRQAFPLLMELLESQHEEGKPFFTVMYTFGTHASFRSPDEVYGDGSDHMLNKFCNLDVQLNAFVEAFRASALSGDTVLIITADHATYQDSAFTATFPDHPRRHTEVDAIPLLIWHAGVEPQVVDAGGRNSLDLVPTALDYLDVSEPNYFLGDSLFAPLTDGERRYDLFFFDGTSVMKTLNGVVTGVDVPEIDEFIEDAARYFSIARDKLMLEQYVGCDIEATYHKKQLCLDVAITRIAEGDDPLTCAIWCSRDGQEGQVWYDPVQGEDGRWHVTVDLTEYEQYGVYNIVVYTVSPETQEKCKLGSTFILID